MSNSLKIERLEAEINTLKEQNAQLELNAQKLKDELNFVINYSQDTKKSIFKIRELEEANFDLKTLIARKESEFKLERRNLEAKHEVEVNKLKSEIQLINHKYDTMMRYELYINKIEEINRELTEKIKEMEEEYALGIKAEEKKFEIKLGLIQQKTLNILSESKQNIQNNAVLNMNNSYKLINLQVNELHHQLSEQSAMLEELVKQLNKKEKLIQSLKINISVYKEVEKIIVTQNRRLSKLIKKMLDNKRVEGDTKQYMHESRKFLHILKNVEITETEDSLDEKLGKFDSNNAFNQFNSKFSLNKNVSGNINNKNNFDKIDRGGFSSYQLLNPKLIAQSNTNPNSLVNKEISRIKLNKMENVVGIVDSPVKPKKDKNSADNLNFGNSSDYNEKGNSRLLNIDKNTIITNENFNEHYNNTSGTKNKLNSKSVNNDNIFAKYLSNTFHNFSEKSNLQNRNSVNNDNVNPHQNSESKKTSIQNYYQNLNNSNDLTDKNSNKKNSSNYASSINKSAIHFANKFNLAEKNNANNVASTINIKEGNNPKEAFAAKGHFNNIRGKNYNNSSLLDDMNSTMEFGSTFVKNFGLNNLNKLQNRERDSSGCPAGIEAKFDNLCVNNSAGLHTNFGNVNELVRENENEVGVKENGDMKKVNNKKNEREGNLSEKSKNKSISKVTSKVGKLLKNNKFVRNNQILDKYEAELIMSRDKEILGLI